MIIHAIFSYKLITANEGRQYKQQLENWKKMVLHSESVQILS